MRHGQQSVLHITLPRLAYDTWRGHSSFAPTAGSVTLVSVYAPTLSARSDTKDDFYDKLRAIISSTPSKKQLVLLGDLNTRVGADHDSWPSCLGQFGVGKMDSNG